MGIRADAPNLPALFEEAALAVAEIAADASTDAGGRPGAVGRHVALEADDLPGLAFAWLNELIGLADIHGPLARAEVATVEANPGGRWLLRGHAAFGGGASPRLDIKSATYHGLVVERIGEGWRMTAYLDV
jgi:SHS2 domain-containing protein